MAKGIAQHFSRELLVQDRKNSLSKTTSNSIPNHTIISSAILKDKNSQPALYIFNFAKESGFVVISAEAKHEPICAYVDHGNAIPNDSVPGGLMNWFDKTIENIEIVREGRYDNTARAKFAWIDLLKKTNTPSLIQELRPELVSSDPEPDPCAPWFSNTKGPLLTTTWGQGCSYNELCPNKGCVNVCTTNQNAWTGCVATAVAQVIRYWHPSTQPYNFASMPNTFGNNEVQRLMRDVGLHVFMTYGCAGSSAYGSNIPAALKGGSTANNFWIPSFGFSSATLSSYNYSDYIDVRNNIDWGFPVLLSACATKKRSWVIFWKYSDCHEWVTDGYDNYGSKCWSFLFFHMNWGWHEVGLANDYNGWFLFNSWNPTGTQNFQYARDYIHNIHL